MFTGLIQSIGVVEHISSGTICDLWVNSHFENPQFVLGESIACDGCCLTVVEVKDASFKVQATSETLARTTLGLWKAGRPVNLERALRMGDRLGGHWLQGHVDGVGEVTQCIPDGDAKFFSFSLPGDLSKYVVEKGSIAVDGVSLTVNAVENEGFSVMLIPETLQRTSLGSKAIGSKVNLEVDILGKYVARLMQTHLRVP